MGRGSVETKADLVGVAVVLPPANLRRFQDGSPTAIPNALTQADGTPPRIPLSLGLSAALGKPMARNYLSDLGKFLAPPGDV
jgi:hypothetical protein